MSPTASRASALRLSFLLLWRYLLARELNLLLVALLVAVAAVTTVGFFVDRLDRALNEQALHLLGGDLVLRADRPIPEDWTRKARALGLRVAHTASFPSMAMAESSSPDADAEDEDEALPPTQLASVLAVSHDYPLRGELTVTADEAGPSAGVSGTDDGASPDRAADSQQAPAPGPSSAAAPTAPDDPQARTSQTIQHGPPAGSVFVDESLAQALSLKLGDTLTLGNARFTIDRFILMEPSRGASFVNFASRLMLSIDDLPATGLVRPGSRISHGLLVAGEAQAVSEFQDWLQPRLGAGQRLENLEAGRPEIQNTLARARQFLALVSLLSALIAAVAIGLGARRFAERHLDGFAILKAMGLTQRVLARTLMLEMLWLALAGGALGVTLGWVAHHALTGVARVMLETSLPAASAWPALQALLVAVVLVLGFAAVPVLRLAGVTPLRVLRRDLGAPGLSVWLVLLVALGAFGLLLFWLVGEARLSLLALGGFVVAGLVFVLLAMCGVWLAAHLRPKRTRGGWALVLRLALTGWSRRLSMTAVQIVALTIGLMALLLLTVVRNDLLAAWQQAAPPDAPNRFVINIQPDQQADVRRMLAEAGLGEVPLYPMVRGRLVAINDRPVRPQDYPDDRAQRLVDREFNLSYTDRMPGHNRLAAGRWIHPQAAEVSAEVGIMNTLGLKLGDHLRFDVAGQPVEMTLVGSRELKWDSMQVNFFMIGSPAALATQPQSLITSFHLPPGREGLVRQLTRAMPNLTIVDTGAITAQIQTMIGQVVQAVQFLFLFTLAAGCVVLYAAMGSVRDERVAEIALMRALGASRRQLGLVQLLELSLTGLLAGLMGAAGATLLGWLLAREVFDFAYQPSLWLLSGSILASMLFIVLAGGWNIWRLLDTPPLRALRGA
ncbi:FtsX-like permease family protein [Lautropia mirabilis]|uniref:ABC transporter permease n=1 Tax=Lautropia mirabilis TaxID=47671 RepID=UPI00288ACF1E|nr:FtsX-like permease family protein [Lautropia mirabilis]